MILNAACVINIVALREKDKLIFFCLFGKAATIIIFPFFLIYKQSSAIALYCHRLPTCKKDQSNLPDSEEGDEMQSRSVFDRKQKGVLGWGRTAHGHRREF